MNKFWVFVRDLTPMPFRRFVRFLKYRLIQARMFFLYKSFVSRGGLVFDVGANVGLMSEVFRFLGARVVCIEPNPACVSVLKRKFKGDSSVSVVSKGVGSRSGRLFFNVSDDDAGAVSTFSSDWVKSERLKSSKWVKRISVPVTTLDLLVGKFGVPCFVKIDVEGFEFEVLKGLSTPVSLSFEFTGEFFDSFVSCVKRLMRLGGAVFNFCSDASYRFVFSEWLSGVDFIEGMRPLGFDCGDVYVKFVS